MDVLALEFNLVWDANCETGESPVWDSAREMLWFCDSPSGRILGYAPAEGQRWKHRIDDAVGSLALCSDGRLLVACRDNIILFDPDGQTKADFCRIPDMPKHCRLNDGKVGPDGAFWVGAADLSPNKREVCALYRVCPDGTVEKKTEGLKASNGLAWSDDGSLMYHSDSRGPWIDRYAFDPSTGAMWDRTRIAEPTVDIGRPDGAATTTDGLYWSAGVSAGCLNVFDASGTIVRKVPTTVKTPTMPCFANGGVFVTSLWGASHRSAQENNPLSGGLFFAETDACGVEIPLFDLENGT